MTGRAERFRGALVGTAVGDALGAAFEGRPHVAEDEVDAQLDATDPARFTDDTAMTIAFARSLVVQRGLDLDHLAEAFVRAHHDEPWRGYGPGPPRIFARIERGTPWRDAAGDQYGGEGSFGNGGAMRAAPAALIGYGDLDRTASVAADQAAVTHAHPLGRDGAAVQAVAVGALLAGAGNAGPRAVLDAVRPHARTDAFADRLDAVAELVDGTDPSEVAARVGNGITAQEAVPAALCAALVNLGSVADTLRFAFLLGGDTDTIGAMAGALAGAHGGLTAIPDGWRERVEGVDELSDLADRLRALVAA